MGAFIEPMLIFLSSGSSQNRLHVACSFGLLHAANAFLELGDDPNTFDSAGYTPLMWSSRRGMYDILETLLNHGADPNLMHPKLGVTALHEAVSNYQAECCEKLLVEGADPNIQDRKGRTGIHTAACLQEIEIHNKNELNKQTAALVNMLLKHEADPSILDLSGRNALNVAEDRGALSIAVRIRRSMAPGHELKHNTSATDSEFFELEPVRATAIRKERLWSRMYGSGDASFVRTIPYIKFVPCEDAGNGPTILLYDTWAGDEEEEAERYVSSLNATVYVVPQLWQTGWYRPTMQTEAKIVEHFVEDVCGFLDCVIVWCWSGEFFFRLAAARPDLVGSIVGVAARAMSGPLPPDQMKWMLETICVDPAGMADMVLKTTTSTSFQRSPEYAKALTRICKAMEKYGKLVQKEFDDCTNQKEHILEFSQWRCFVDFSPWAHWKSITQPVLVIVGVDDAMFLNDTEFLVATVPNAEVEYVRGGHYPKQESPKQYLASVLCWLRKHCSARKNSKLDGTTQSCFSDATSTTDTLAALDMEGCFSVIFDDEDQVTESTNDNVHDQPQCCGKMSAWQPGRFQTTCSVSRPSKATAFVDL